MKRPLSSLLVLASALYGVACTVNSRDDNPCDPSPCKDANKSVCVEEAGEARCLCDAGFLARPNGACEPVSATNCAEHGGDLAEPDDCQVRARIIDSGPARQQTIDPIGDYDFFQFAGTSGHVYSLIVRAEGSLMPRVDVFDQGGVWLAASEAPNRTDLYFKAHSTANYFARVSHSPVDPSVATGGYSLTFASLGQEDHGDFAEDATRIYADPFNATTPTSNNGRFEYPRDDDWFTFSGSRSRNYRLSFDPNRSLPAVAVYMGNDLRQPLFTAQNATVDFNLPADGTAFLVVYSPQGNEGSYAFNFFTD
ncbi:hypothetical protein [Hyalangium rubrum]|uniref:EGF-like domain-containing protein n=1 Tax=Hyalangium rubrum TaxID=3103134 RepID=A0ABU5GV75_9BACT|nr:hypothetical protein [Hyalangium sp. s54d21]MDY7224769.1 hypothetical protein [Hyalangium sp. s54d21]